MALKDQTTRAQRAATALADAAARLVEAVLAGHEDAAEIRQRHDAGRIGFLVEINELRGLATVSTWTRTEQERWLGYIAVNCGEAFASTRAQGGEGGSDGSELPG